MPEIFTDIFAAARWWLVLALLGLAAFPLTHRFFRRLPERGYAVTKMLGVLLVSYLFWLLATLGFVGNDAGGIVLALLLVLGGSAWISWRDGGAAWHWLRGRLGLVLLMELIFLLGFALWTYARTQNPAISATEKPMEFAFLNAIGRSPQFPPLDPWLSGFSISYYYFGYVMVSVIARLAAVAEPVAFNLGVAWLGAGAGLGAFGVVYDLIAARGAQPTADEAAFDHGNTPGDEGGGMRSAIGRRAAALALIAALAVPVAGNLNILLEVAHANGVGSTELWEWLDVRDLNQAPPEGDAIARYETSQWWWWRSSRVIRDYYFDGTPEDGLSPIAEFPAFSFVLGDMHPHVLALPFAFLGILLALRWWLAPLPRARPAPEETAGDGSAWRLAWESPPVEYVRDVIADVGAGTWLLTALLLGGFAFLNTWDVLVYAFLVVGAYLLALWRRDGRWHAGLVGRAATMGVLLVVPAYLLYYPFFIAFDSQAGPPFLLPMLMAPTRLVHYLIIFGMPLLLILPFLLGVLWRQRGRGWRLGFAAGALLPVALAAVMIFFGSIVALAPDGAGRIVELGRRLGMEVAAPAGSAANPGWALQTILQLTPAILLERLQTPWLILLLALMAGGVAMALWSRLQRDDGVANALPANRTLPFALLLVLTGVLLTIGPEFVYLRDNFGVRMNTIFKFYYQTWVLFGVVALYGLDDILRRSRIAGAALGVGYAALLAGALLFPYYGIRSRGIEYRGAITAEERRPATLDGLAYVGNFNPDELAAIEWLRDNVEGAPVVLEAVGGQYSGYGRVSAQTGLPTLLGWAGHQFQWRGYDTPEPNVRDEVVRRLYSEPRWSDDLAALLNQYDVEYIYVGSLERNQYTPQGAEKFAERLPAVFSNDTVTIYRWQPQ